MSARPSLLVRLCVLLTLVVPVTFAHPAFSRGNTPRILPGPVVSTDRAPAAPLPQRWIVRLKDAPLAQSPVVQSPQFATSAQAAAGIKRLQTETTEAKQYRALLRQQQDRVVAAIKQSFPLIQVQRRYDLLFNGMGVTLPNASDAAVARLRALPGVAEIYPDQAYQLNMFSSTPLIGADALWKSRAIGGQANAGKGVKVAIIDGGIRADNPFFNPAGFSYPPGFPKGDAAYATPKVIVARAYFRPDRPPQPGSETPWPGPDDTSHGTHVAGTAAGVANTSALIGGLTIPVSGVAPAAYLMNYKVFYANEESQFSAYSVELMAALEDAVADGADVINNSWGGTATTEPRGDPLTLAAEAAVDAGVTVVFSAGNEGPNPSTAGSPAYSDKVISVGASTTAQTIVSGFVDVTAPEGAPDSVKQQRYRAATFGPTIRDAIWGPFPYASVATVSNSTLACDALPAGSLSGQVALIERGVCPFSLKVLNAQIGGANSAIVYNSEAGGDQLIGMSGGDLGDEVGIPSIFVGRSTGLALLDWARRAGPAARVQIDPRARVVDQAADVLAPFSSRGPTFQGSLKPDVVAPGVNILSSGYADAEGVAVHQGFGLVSGTSMASPHVTGAAALLKQIHPNWTPADVKSALMSSAVTDVWLDEDRSEAANVLQRGAGRIDVNRAANVVLLFDRPTLSFGNLSALPGQSTRAELAVGVRNVSGARQSFTLGSHTTGGAFSITVAPASLTLAAGQSARFTVAIEVPAGAPAADYGGLVTLEGAQSLHLPLWARTLPAQAGAKVLLIDNDGSSSLDLPDYSGYYGNALGELGISFEYLDVDKLAGEEQTLPEIGVLQRHEIILWFTGDNAVFSGALGPPTPLTATDQNLLIAYLQSGGSLIATGQDLSFASDINPDPNPVTGGSDLYRGYLNASLLQDDVFSGTQTLERNVVGTNSQAWLDNLVLDLSRPAGEASDKSGAGNQTTVDETNIINTDPRTPTPWAYPIFRAASTDTTLGGVVGINTAAQPTLEKPLLDFKYRTTYLSFGLEGVRSDSGKTTRKELLQAILYWTVDRPTVRIEGTALVADPNRLVNLTAVAESNTPASFVRYRWDFGDGSAIVETDAPTVSYQYPKAGTYTPRVEVTDSWGHRAIGGLAAAGPQGAKIEVKAAVAPARTKK